MLTLYARPGCGHCQAAKNWLQENDFAFIVVDVMADPEALDFLKRQGHRTVPQCYRDGTLVADGFAGLRALGAERLRCRMALPGPQGQPAGPYETLAL